MEKLMKKIILLGLVVLLGGCETVPVKQEEEKIKEPNDDE